MYMSAAYLMTRQFRINQGILNPTLYFGDEQGKRVEKIVCVIAEEKSKARECSKQAGKIQKSLG